MFTPLLPLYALQRKMVYAGVDEERRGMADYIGFDSTSFLLTQMQ